MVSIHGDGKIPAGERVTLRLPTEFLAGTTTATLVVSGRPSAQLLAAARFNAHYPYGCLEQVVSAAFPLLYLNEIQQASLSHAETTRGMALKVQAVMEQLAAMQTTAGGLAMWPGGRKPWTWGSIYAAHFLVEAQRAGFDVWPEQLELLLDWISKRVLLFAQMDKLSDSQLTERAYATLVMARAGRNVRDHMELLYDVRNRLSSSARALLASAYLSMGSVSEADTLLGMAEIGRASGATAGFCFPPLFAKRQSCLLPPLSEIPPHPKAWRLRIDFLECDGLTWDIGERRRITPLRCGPWESISALQNRQMLMLTEQLSGARVIGCNLPRPTLPSPTGIQSPESAHHHSEHRSRSGLRVVGCGRCPSQT